MTDEAWAAAERRAEKGDLEPGVVPDCEVCGAPDEAHEHPYACPLNEPHDSRGGLPYPSEEGTDGSADHSG